jgi:hypothetical protein
MTELQSLHGKPLLVQAQGLEKLVSRGGAVTGQRIQLRGETHEPEGTTPPLGQQGRTDTGRWTRLFMECDPSRRRQDRHGHRVVRTLAAQRARRIGLRPREPLPQLLRSAKASRIPGKVDQIHGQRRAGDLVPLGRQMGRVPLGQPKDALDRRLRDVALRQTMSI